MKKLKEATLIDFDSFYNIKCEEKNIYWTGHSEKPNYEDLKKWYENQLFSDKRKILFLHVGNQIVGHAYIIIQDDHVETAVAVSMYHEGKGYGKEIISRTIEKSLELFAEKPIYAWILEDNLASIKIHQTSGYIPSQDTKITSNGLMRKYIYTAE